MKLLSFLEYPTQLVVLQGKMELKYINLTPNIPILKNYSALNHSPKCDADSRRPTLAYLWRRRPIKRDMCEDEDEDKDDEMAVMMTARWSDGQTDGWRGAKRVISGGTQRRREASRVTLLAKKMWSKVAQI